MDKACCFCENYLSYLLKNANMKGKGSIMTVSSQVKQTLASLKGAQANLESFALATQNEQAKQMYTQAAQNTQSICDTLQQRVTQLENEEPQYKGF